MIFKFRKTVFEIFLKKFTVSFYCRNKTNLQKFTSAFSSLFFGSEFLKMIIVLFSKSVN